MSKHNKRKSPKSIPRTQQDVDRAFEQGKVAGEKLTLALALYTLLNCYGATDADLEKFSKDFHYTLDSIDKGYITEADLLRVLKTEYGTEIGWEGPNAEN